ncbi:MULTISPECIES: hypothetical protein [unclassified Mesorhizobium]|uniref:hypothetical protein n=1 Tax=unclassified Mesorhizobium TaxID=325217 RepID=UPI00112E4AE2|nr:MULTISPECIES: hypothetical protein [unclassified Mesorhizobium]TPN51317.1 hypothetical protein FJ978_13365 [Mesorhizobium sp. B1-1-7]TPN56578.1 hypothetical protein FJ976_05995 [Mesorhizobium sp. B1-1-9]
MSDIPAEEIEGRLNAIRVLVTLLLTEAAKDSSNPEHLFEQIEDELQLQNHQKDPGVLPSRAFAIEAAQASELKVIAEGARARLAGLKSKSR